MKPSAELLQSIEQLDATREQMRKLSAGQPEGWKTTYARLRPVFQQQNAAAIGLTDAWLRMNGDEELLSRFRELVAHASSRLAAHQARYPVLVLDGNDPDYVASMKEVNENFDGVLKFVRTALKG